MNKCVLVCLPVVGLLVWVEGRHLEREREKDRQIDRGRSKNRKNKYIIKKKQKKGTSTNMLHQIC